MKALPDTDELTPELVEQVGREYLEALLKAARPEYVLKHYTPEQRLDGLDLEQRLAGLDLDDVASQIERLRKRH